MRPYRALSAAALAAALLTVSACASDAGSSSGGDGSLGPLKIDALAALSGPVAPAGESMASAMKAAIKVINKNGGVFGKPVELNIIDNAGSADQTAAKLQELLSKGKPHGVVAGSAAEIPAAIPILAQAGVFTAHHFTSAAFNDPKKYPDAFGQTFSIPAYVASFVEQLTKDGRKKIGVLDTDDAAGQAFEAVAKPAFEKAGMTATFSRVPPTAIDAIAQLQQVMAANPDALLFAGYSPAAGPMAKARQTLGVTIPTYGAMTYSANQLDKLAPVSAYDGMLFQQLSTSVKGTAETQSAEFQTFYNAVLEETGGKMPFPINTYLVAWNDIMMIKYAAELSNSVDPKKMTAAIESAAKKDMPLYLAPVGFSKENHFAAYGPANFVFTSYAPVDKGLNVPTS